MVKPDPFRATFFAEIAKCHLEDGEIAEAKEAMNRVIEFLAQPKITAVEIDGYGAIKPAPGACSPVSF